MRRDHRKGQEREGDLRSRALEATAVLLFLLQAVRVLLSVLFGLIYNVVFAETLGFGTLGAVVVLVLCSFLLPLAAPLHKQSGLLLATALVAALARIPLSINQPTVRLVSSLIVTASATAYAAALLYGHHRVFAAALVAACAIDQLLRAAGNTYDLALRGWWLPVQAVISLGMGVVAWRAFSSSQRPAYENAPGAGIDIPSGLALGTLVFVETSLLGFPNALARWTGATYALVAPLLMAATLLPLLRARRWGGLAILGATLGVGLLTGHELHQLGTLAPMLLAQFAFLSAARTLAEPGPSGHPRLSVALGMLLFLALHVVLALAFTYPYTIPSLRDKGDYVFLVAFLFLLVPAIGSGSSAKAPGRVLRSPGVGWMVAAALVVATAAFAYPPRLAEPEANSGRFRVGTYNIHYGYNSSWRFSLADQARAIERSAADIVMLQEVDAGRITSYGVDDALWLARRLGMDYAFGPTLEDLSGVALLSRFPVAEADSQLLASQLEQTAIVWARLEIAGQELDAYGTWLGLEPGERARQWDDAKAYIGGASPAVLGGDFNATPGSPTYERIRAAGFDDPFVVGSFDPAPSSPAVDPVERIDFVWTRGLGVTGAEVLDALASDHRLVVVELAAQPDTGP
jgi:endonuclease/exonuclease/phosphatase family metal-dependent hydrolase